MPALVRAYLDSGLCRVPSIYHNILSILLIHV